MTHSTLLALFALGCGQAIATPPTATPAVPSTVADSTVSYGTPVLQGTVYDKALPAGSIDMDLVAQAIDRHLDDLKQCYDKRLEADPKLSGVVLIHWSITTDGDFDHGCITNDTVGDEAILACVNEVVAAADYPAAAGQTASVSFPFWFKTGS